MQPIVVLFKSSNFALFLTVFAKKKWGNVPEEEFETFDLNLWTHCLLQAITSVPKNRTFSTIQQCRAQHQGVLVCLAS